MADRDELLDHDYDGIQEYDNDLPRWWVWLFWVTIAFAVVRTVYYHWGPGMLQEERFEVAMGDLEAIREIARSAQGPDELSEATLLRLVEDTSVLEAGKKIYASNCAACHAAEGQGLIGPNLTDDYWIHGGGVMDIYRVTVEGVPEKGMISWRGVLSESDIRAVTAFIWTLRGSEPTNPKAPEGEFVAGE